MSISVDIRKAFSEFTLDVSFQVERETLGFLGASGSGKSLTLRCIAGLEKPDSGRIVVGDRVFFDSEKAINLSPQQRKTALLFQSYMLFPNLTVAENIKAGLPRSISRHAAHEIVGVQLERFGLTGFGHRFPSSLSGGQQQRVALARMLAAKPEILMLDEPFSALDAHLKGGLEQDLLDLFDEFAGSILYISHDIDEAFRFCDRIAVVDNGRIAQIGRASEILSKPTSLAALKVSGVKNISAMRPTGVDAPTKVLAVDWGLELECEKIIPEDARWLGVRATFLRPINDSGADNKVNTFSFTVRRVIDSRFERTVVLEPSGIVWRFNFRQMQEANLPQKGDIVRIQIPPEHIYLVGN